MTVIIYRLAQSFYFESKQRSCRNAKDVNNATCLYKRFHCRIAHHDHFTLTRLKTCESHFTDSGQTNDRSFVRRTVSCARHEI